MYVRLDAAWTWCDWVGARGRSSAQHPGRGTDLFRGGPRDHSRASCVEVSSTSPTEGLPKIRGLRLREQAPGPARAVTEMVNAWGFPRRPCVT